MLREDGQGRYGSYAARATGMEAGRGWRGWGPGGSQKCWVAPGGRAVAWGRGLGPLRRGFGSEPGAGPPFGEGLDPPPPMCSEPFGLRPDSPSVPKFAPPGSRGTAPSQGQGSLRKGREPGLGLGRGGDL